MIKTAADVAADQAAGIRRAQEAHCIDLVFRATPTLIRNQANARIILDDLNHFTNGEVPTLADWELMLAANPSYIKTRLAVTTEAVRKEALVEQIMKLLRDHGPKQSEWTFLNEQKRLSLPSVSVQELEDRLADIQNKQRLAKMSVAQIQNEIASTRPQPQGRVVLPVEFTVRTIKSMGVDALKNLIRTYGTAAVNDRLFGRS